MEEGIRGAGSVLKKRARLLKRSSSPRQTIDEIIVLAKGAPSSMNTQPWYVHVRTDAPLEVVGPRNTGEMPAGAQAKRDIHTHGPKRAKIAKACPSARP